MAIATPAQLEAFYCSNQLGFNGAAPAQYTIQSGSTRTALTIAGANQATDFWNGATGFVCGTQATSSLKGETFHVRSWNKETNTLLLASPLSVTPEANDTLVLFAGGLYPSNVPVLQSKCNGMQPEVNPPSIAISGQNAVMAKKVSSYLGEGTLQFQWNGSSKTLAIRMGSSEDWGPSVTLSGNVTDQPIYRNDNQGFVIVDVNYALLPTGAGTVTVSATIVYPSQNILANQEGYETNTNAGLSRYKLIALKNLSSDALTYMTGLGIWSAKPAGTDTTLNGSLAAPTTNGTAQNVTVTNAANWPLRGFWIRNTVNKDIRYVNYRNGNTLYLAPVLWGLVPFQNGTTGLMSGAYIESSYLPATNNAVIDQVIIEAGSLEAGTASGTLIVKRFLGSFGNSYQIRNNNSVQIASSRSPGSTRGWRGITAVSWSSGNGVELFTPVDLGFDLMSDGTFRDIPNSYTAPTEIVFSGVQDSAAAIEIETLTGGSAVGVWIRETIPSGAQSITGVDASINAKWY
ncbi:MAG: hypothetical protein ACRC10_05525 [Thermoguttaceae bacterium]